MNSLIFCTFFRCFHLLDKMSQFFALETITRERSSNFKSVATSPVNKHVGMPIVFSNFSFQSAYRASAMSSMGAQYTHLAFSTPCVSIARKMANSAQTDFPEPAGADTYTLSSESVNA